MSDELTANFSSVSDDDLQTLLLIAAASSESYRYERVMAGLMIEKLKRERQREEQRSEVAKARWAAARS